MKNSDKYKFVNYQQELHFEIIYKAYLDGSFRFKSEIDRNGLLTFIKNIQHKYNEFFICEYDGMQICFICAKFDGWKYEPHVEFFTWATKKHILHSTIEFLIRLKRLDSIGVVVIKAMKQSVNLFDHVCKHNVLQFIGMIPKGDYRGDEYIYTTSGNAKSICNTATPAIGKI